jgi:hypothetical protein
MKIKIFFGALIVDDDKNGRNFNSKYAISLI